MHRDRFRMAAPLVLSVVACVFLMGDFCADVLGFPVLVENAQDLDMALDLSQFVHPAGTKKRATEATPVSPRADGDLDVSGEIPENVGDLDLSEIDAGDVDLSEVDLAEAAGEFADVDLNELLSELDIDLTEVLTGAGIENCDRVQPSKTVAGEGCFCRRPGAAGEPERMIVKSGCLLGQLGVDLVNLDPQVKKVAKLVSGIFVRGIDYSLYAKDLAVAVPCLKGELLAIDPLKSTVPGEPDPSTSDVFTVRESIPAGKLAAIPAQCGVTGAGGGMLGPGAENLDLFSPDKIERCADLEGVASGKRFAEALAALDEAAWKSRDGICPPPGMELPCGLTCRPAEQLPLPIDQVSNIADVLETLRFGVRVTTTAPIDVTHITGTLLTKPEDAELLLKLRMRFKVVIVVVPNL